MRIPVWALHLGQVAAVVAVVFGLTEVALADVDDCGQEVRRDTTQPNKHWLHVPCNTEQVCWGEAVTCEAKTITEGPNVGYMYCRCPEGPGSGMCKVAFKSDGGVVMVAGVPYPSGTGKCVNYSCASNCPAASWTPVSGTTQKLDSCPCP